MIRKHIKYEDIFVIALCIYFTNLPVYCMYNWIYNVRWYYSSTISGSSYIYIFLKYYIISKRKVIVHIHLKILEQIPSSFAKKYFNNLNASSKLEVLMVKKI